MISSCTENFYTWSNTVSKSITSKSRATDNNRWRWTWFSQNTSTLSICSISWSTFCQFSINRNTSSISIWCISTYAALWNWNAIWNTTSTSITMESRIANDWNRIWNTVSISISVESSRAIYSSWWAWLINWSAASVVKLEAWCALNWSLWG